jgi:hypothetical protein
MFKANYGTAATALKVNFFCTSNPIIGMRINNNCNPTDSTVGNNPNQEIKGT